MPLGSVSRFRAVSSGSVVIPGDEDIANLVQELYDLELTSWAHIETGLAYSGCLQQLRYLLKEEALKHKPQDSFRRAQGFQSLLRVLECLQNVWHDAAAANKTKDAIQTLSQLLAVLEAALEHHSGNNKYFQVKTEGGWQCVQNVLRNVLIYLMEQDEDSLHVEHFFGILLAVATGCEAVSDVYLTISKAYPSSTRRSLFEEQERIETGVKKAITVVNDLLVPDMLTITVTIWSYYLSQQKQVRPLNLAFPFSLQALLNLSRQNTVLAHTSDLLSILRPLLFDGSHSPQEKVLYQNIALLLCEEGVPHLDDAQYFFSRASSSPAAAKFLLDMIHASRKPPSIQFDLSRHGSSAIELANLRRPFPSPETPGYSLALWVRFDRFDDRAHTTLFGAFDKTQTCFVLTYLEKDTKHLILQTAIRGFKPSVRFKSTTFCTDRWYHICITHKKPKTISSSRASLFVDGEFVEQVKATFPAGAPVDRSSGTVKVQTFIGTPQDLSPTTGSIPCTSQWSLANAMLFEDIISDDFISVIYHLGPEYYGNLQDCLGSFQTYHASTALNLRNESLNPGKEEASDLVLASRHRASNILDERRILLNISPTAVLDGDDRNNVDETVLIKSLSKLAAKNLFAYTRSTTNAIAINGAVPAINDALVQTNGVAMLMGEPTVTVPQSLDDVSWRLGGCASIGLSLVQRARTTEDVSTAVDILLAIVKDSWRNSEVMERHNGYGVLGHLIKEKLSSFSEGGRGSAAIPTPNLDRIGLGLKLLKSILAFVGYDEKDETKCILDNALAYRILLIDTNIWRCHSAGTQELFFKQIVVFAVQSYHSRFNLKRLNRMRALRKLLEALKGDPIPRSIMPLYSAALKALFPSAMSTEMLRSVALFITYSIHKRNSNSRYRKHLPSEPRSRGSSGSGSSTPVVTSEDSTLSRFEIGVEILRLYSDMLCNKGDANMIKKFAKTVTNKWLLYLLSESSAEVVVLSVRVLARLLVVHGDAYVRKFKDKSGGFTIMCHRLKRWWHLPALWPACFAILFGVDVAELNLDRSFDLFSFVELFDSQRNYKVAYPDMFEVIAGMLLSGLRTIASSNAAQAADKLAPPRDSAAETSQPPQRLSMSSMAPSNPYHTIATAEHIETFNIIIRFLADLQSRSEAFRDFATTSSYIQDLLHVLFPVVVGSDVVEASVELDARDSVLSFEGMDVIVHPLTKSMPFVSESVEETAAPPSRGKILRRGSSFVMVSREQMRQASSASTSRGRSPLGSSVSKLSEPKTENNSIVQGILELIVSIFIEQILARKEFPGLGLFVKTPPGFVEHQHYFESWILRNTVSQLSSAISLNQKVLCEPKVLTNLARFVSHLGEALFEGWFVGGAEPVLDLAGSVLEYLQRSDISQLKSVRLCTQPISVIRIIVFRIVLLSLSQAQGEASLEVLFKLNYWQSVLLASEDAHPIYLQHICYLLYGDLVSSSRDVRLAAADLWRVILVQRPTEAAKILGQADSAEEQRLVHSFEELVELDNETFLQWVDDHKDGLDTMFLNCLSRSWESFVNDENKRTEDAARARIQRRREKLKVLAREEAEREESIRRHEVTFDHWTNNIYSSEHLKYQRLMQDQQDDRVHIETSFRRMQRELARSTGLFAEQNTKKWRLDQTEGRNRMRMRLVEDFSKESEGQQSKRKGSDIPTLKLDTKGLRSFSSDPTPVTSAIEPPSAISLHHTDGTTEPFPDVRDDTGMDEAIDIEESFEMIEDPNAEQDDFEDKNRKVMRSLQHGDQVKHVANISRIVGLEAIEGLLILGKDNIYFIDNFFQRADNEIVNVWQAPQEERDPYVRMISGRDVVIRKPQSRAEHEARNWKWSEIISVSKRRFLFRDVAIEIFFGDGRSYLLTLLSTTLRNDLYTRINNKAPQYGNIDSPQSEHAWRYDTLKSPEEETQSLGARFGSLFSQSSGYTATKKWQKGEMSNFHYLMLINTMAGRTYNDLTQYPVFPWVIADYTSSELDLTDPKTFRDLSKPMGCQTKEREAEFKDRYKSFAEMGDHNAPAFHYGTHYSSAMIVTSYLIRLQPFVKSYLLLQGGSFDHADRMFFSIEQAWRSASTVNMTDVRELTPEFFYLPEFLTNPNGYDFGKRQNSTKSIGDVELPPWAKGDPRIFIAKQREALESPYVSKHLHKWIDLIFGCKQKGESAIEAVNVFHHLSYQGAKDLDAIDDSVERLATIGIIHNFGQTPHQIFPRAHPAREHTHHKYKRIDTAVESLTRLPPTLLDSEVKVASLTYAWKADKLLCSGAFRLNIPPNYEKYMEWGFFDGSIRFYSADTRKQVGLFEHLHIGQLSCALFADSKTLVTAGVDCTVAVWSLVTTGKTIDLQPRATLFGHHRPVTSLSMSRSFNALLSASSCGELMLWDLNRCEFVRKITPPSISGTVTCTSINDVTGNIVICHDSFISIYGINGDLILSQDTSDRSPSSSHISSSPDDAIISVTCYEGAGNEWLERDILFTGHKKGIVKVWNRVINSRVNASASGEGIKEEEEGQEQRDKESPFELELIRQLNHVDPSREDGGNVNAGISCILAMPQVVYTGDEDGRVLTYV